MDPHSIPHSDVPPTHKESQVASQHQYFYSKEWKHIPITLKIRIATTPIPLDPGKTATEIRACLKWEAQLDVKAKDMPRLMREGFHWTSANCHHESTYFTDDVDTVSREYGWNYARHYFLSDLDGDPYWTARLTVWARDVQSLAQFRVDNVRPDMVYTVVGRNVNKEWIYFFALLDPSKNINAIYDDMPLKGWWPWPKDKEKQLMS